MKVSVIIPTYNRRELLARTLATVFAQDLSPEFYEVIVVVDGSTDGTSELLRTFHPACELHFIEQPNRGPAAARNAGAFAARGDLILFLDDDILCAPDLLRLHREAHRGSDHLFVFGPVYLAQGTPRTPAADWWREVTTDYYQRLIVQGEPRWPEDATVEPNGSLRRSVFLACGGYDERFFRSHEDADLGLRLWKMGVRFNYLPEAVAHHVYVKSPRHLLKQEVRLYARNELLLCRKHPEYRSHSGLAGLAEGPWWKRWRRQLVIRWPVPPRLVLAACSVLVNPLSRVPALQAVRKRLFAMRMQVESLSASAREAGSYAELRKQFGMRLPVLLYHRVGPPQPGTFAELTLPPAQFERQMHWLAKHGYTGIRLADWPAWCRQGKSLPPKPVLVTFDDAYADVAKHALPLLRRLGFGATVFVVTGRVGETNTWDAGQTSAPLSLMTADDIREWAARGIDFGAHSRSHRDLRLLPTDDLVDEVAGSREDLARILGRPPVCFAYPYGEWDEAVREVVRGRFDLAFTCEEGMNPLRTDPLLVRRTMVQPTDSLMEFAGRVRWGRNPLADLRARLRKLAAPISVFPRRLRAARKQD